MERTERASVVPADIDWNDIGAWSALWDVGTKDAAGNVVRGDVWLDGVTNSLRRIAHGDRHRTYDVVIAELLMQCWWRITAAVRRK